MTAIIKGITLRRKNNDRPFLTKLLDISCLDSDQLKVGTIITTKTGMKYKVVEILNIDFTNSDIELLVKDINIGT